MTPKPKNQKIDADAILKEYSTDPQKYVEFQKSIIDKPNLKNHFLKKDISDYKNIDAFLKDFIESFASFGIQLRIPTRNGSGFLWFNKTKKRHKIRFMKTEKNHDNEGLKGSQKNFSKCMYFLYNSKNLSSLAFKRMFFDYNIFEIHHADQNKLNDSKNNLVCLTIKQHKMVHKLLNQ